MYKGVGTADGVVFMLQNDSLNALGGYGGALGYGTANGGTPITPSAGLAMNIYTGFNGITDIAAGASLASGGNIGSYASTSPVNLASGDPIQVTVSYDGTNNLGVTFSDSTAHTTYNTSYTVGNLEATLGAAAYVGFSGAAGGFSSTQTIANFGLTEGGGAGSASNVLPTATVLSIAKGGTLDLGGVSQQLASLSGSGSVINSNSASAAVLTISNVATTTFSGTINDSGGAGISLATTGPGTLIINGANAYSGSTSIGGGVLSVAADGALGTAPSSPTPDSLTISGGTLSARSSFTLAADRGIGLGPTGGTQGGAGAIDVVAGANLTYAGVIASAGNSGVNNLVKTGGGTLTLGGSNTFNGATTISGGELAVAADSNLGTVPISPTANSLVLSGGTLSASGSFVLAANRGIGLGPASGTQGGAGVIDVSAGATVSYGGVIASAGNMGGNSLIKTGSGTLVLAATQSYSGATIVAGGTLRLTALPGGSGPAAGLAHRWSFNDSLADSVGGSNASIFGNTALSARPGHHRRERQPRYVLHFSGNQYPADDQLPGDGRNVGHREPS